MKTQLGLDGTERVWLSEKDQGGFIGKADGINKKQLIITVSMH